jgi:transposase
MTSRKRTYTIEFKQEAVQLQENSGKSVYEVETELGITHGLLNKWKRKSQQSGSAAFPGRGKLTAEQEEIRRLQRELAVAQQERDILKKAVAIFSSPSK